MDRLMYLCPNYYENILELLNSGETHANFNCGKCDKNCHIESHDDTLCIYDYVDESWFIAE